MEPEGSLPHSQVSATCPYPKPAWSSPCLPIPILEDKSLLGLNMSLSTLFSKTLSLYSSIKVRDQVGQTE